ncbi:DNA N-6-adenine-methyltransferase [Raoultella terrigena]|uniref:DNA N-6-adenine-methyltransferase n=1 Tax=Raoultella terrigena TaxID=577 RepID=UPI002DB82BC5|nr:DNA N-6-adenine-methyltransferase [Raoultella terrigena]MEB7601945.1 helix-turn-helix domain-containing protein [Raoultella terrigena]
MALRDDCHRYIRHGVNNGGRDDWRSPRKLVESLDNEFDFTIDLAADNNNRVCDRYYSEQDDALLQSWKGERAFCNPPFSRAEEFLAKAGECDVGVFIVPARTGTVYFLKQVFGNPYCHEIRFLNRGVSFLHPDGIPAVRSPLPICILIYRNTVCNDKLIGVHCADRGILLQHVSGRRNGKPLQHSHGVRDGVIQAYRKGASVHDLMEQYAVSRATIYRWIK